MLADVARSTGTRAPVVTRSCIACAAAQPQRWGREPAGAAAAARNAVTTAAAGTTTDVAAAVVPTDSPVAETLRLVGAGGG
jgi:hypothetical protein